MRFWRTQQHLQKPAIPRQGKRRCLVSRSTENPGKRHSQAPMRIRLLSDILCGCDRLEQEDGQMKKAAIILMWICLCLSIPVAAEAAQTGTSSVTQQSTINTTVPDTHMVTIRSEHAQVSYQHEEGDDEETQETVTYAVERFSSPQFQIQPKKDGRSQQCW